MNDIGNMHEVKFDEDLLKIAVRIANCEDLKGGIDIVNAAELEETPDDSGAVPMHLLPMRTEIACVQNLLTCTKFSEPICLLAPYTTEKQIKHGSIGSKCTNGVGKRKLCKAKPPASSVRRFRDLA